MQFDEGTFDESETPKSSGHYTLDAILELIQNQTYSVDTIVGNNHETNYFLSVLLNSDKRPFSYLVDALLVLDKSSLKFKESIINAIYISCGKACEDLSLAISEMGLRLQLPYASEDDLDLYWAKVLSLRRRYLETDEDYRSRLKARVALMKSSGTIPELTALLNTILGMQNAATLRSYWPGEIRVDWNSFSAMKAAEANFDRISEALNESVVAGVTWSTSFPYISYLVDTAISGQKSTSYQVDSSVSKEKGTFYNIVVDLFETASKSYDIDSCIEEAHALTQKLDTKILSEKSKTQLIDACLETPHVKEYLLDVRMRQTKNKAEYVDSVITKHVLLPYRVDGLIERSKRGFYLLTVVISE